MRPKCGRERPQSTKQRRKQTGDERRDPDPFGTWIQANWPTHRLNSGGDVFALVVRRGLILAATGLVVGLAGFAILGRVVAGMLYGVRAFEPFVVATASAVLLLVAVLASTAPAWRAARLEPTHALREQ